MTPVATTLSAARLRVLALALAALVTAAFWLLWPASRDGLVLYASGAAAPRIAEAFTKATGIRITLVRLITGPMLARISAEGDRPGWTLAWFDGDMPAAALDEAGLLARHTTPEVPWTALGKQLLPENGAWTPVGIILAGVTARLRGVIPTSNALGLADPALSGPAYPQIAGILSEAGGWPEGQKTLEHMRDRGLSVSSTSQNVVNQLTSGRIERALLQSSTAYFLASQNDMLQISVPDPAFALPGVIVVAAHASAQHRADADAFIRFALSPDAQRLRLDSGRVDSFYWPVTSDAPAPPATMPRLDKLNLIHLDPYRWGRLQADITDWFETAVARQ